MKRPTKREIEDLAAKNYVEAVRFINRKFPFTIGCAPWERVREELRAAHLWYARKMLRFAAERRRAK